MTMPAILHATQSIWSALAGLAVAVICAWRGKSLLVVAGGACLAVFLLELFL